MNKFLWLLLISHAGVYCTRQQSSSGSHHDWQTGLSPESGFSVPLLTGSINSIPSSDSMNSRLSPPACLAIPENLTLCQGIGYTQMRLPNLLDHDTMAEVSQQAVSWVPLYNLKCHPDTQLFLCSLFTPVCLDRLIFPCRSLCNAVQRGCEDRMKTYGYPWPDMVRCDKFPEDNDMCIGVQTAENSPCSLCRQAETYENLIDNFCRADFVIKTKLKHSNKTQLRCKKAKIFKLRQDIPRKDFRKPILHHTNLSFCCGNILRSAGKKGRLLIMGKRVPHSVHNVPRQNDGLNGEPKYAPTLIMEWGKSKDFKRALKKMRTINCASPEIISESVVPESNVRKPQIMPSVTAMAVRGRGKRKGSKT